MKRFVIGDIHGNYFGMLQALERADYSIANDMLICLGDIVDGLPDSYMCVNFLNTLPNAVFIRGNHDQWFLDFIKTGVHGSHWTQGAQWTLYSYVEAEYGTDSDIISTAESVFIPKHHERFFANQVPYYILEDKFFCHAGFKQEYGLTGNSEMDYMWDRSLVKRMRDVERLGINTEVRLDGIDCKEFYVGHTNVFAISGKDVPLKLKNLYCVDTGGGSMYGKVSVMNIDTKEVFQSDRTDSLYDKRQYGRNIFPEFK